jgi:hypothetical protein
MKLWSSAGGVAATGAGAGLCDEDVSDGVAADGVAARTGVVEAAATTVWSAVGAEAEASWAKHRGGAVRANDRISVLRNDESLMHQVHGLKALEVRRETVKKL